MNVQWYISKRCGENNAGPSIPANRRDDHISRRTVCHSNANAPANSRIGRKAVSRRVGSMDCSRIETHQVPYSNIKSQFKLQKHISTYLPEAGTFSNKLPVLRERLVAHAKYHSPYLHPTGLEPIYHMIRWEQPAVEIFRQKVEEKEDRTSNRAVYGIFVKERRCRVKTPTTMVITTNTIASVGSPW